MMRRGTSSGDLLQDGYRIWRDDDSQVICERVQLRELRPLGVRAVRFGVGPQGGADVDELALTVLADYLGASRDKQAYENATGAQGTALDLHRRLRARVLGLLQLGAGEVWELDAKTLEDWIAAESETLPRPIK